MIQNKKPKSEGRKDTHEKKTVKTELKISERTSLFNPALIPEDAKKIIQEFEAVVSSTHPLNSKQRALLSEQIRQLSHNLTDERGSRRVGYMNQTTALSAYVHYFLWWNLVRLVRLFSNMSAEFFNLDDGSVCVDLGCGPLTVVTALFLARPELRDKKLTWYCIDISQQASAFGEDIFLSVCARLKAGQWKIIRVKGEAGTKIKEKADLVTSANIFNEMNDKPGVPPDFLAKNYTEKIYSYIDPKNPKAKIITIEPGDPKSARLVSLMRDSYIRKGYVPAAPCCHCENCPMNGQNAKKGGKWCNFAFSTEDVPSALKRLSEKADLPKDRAVLCFVAVEKKETAAEKTKETEKSEEKFSFRITSDPLRLPGHRTGYYACSKEGLLLVVTDKKVFSGECFTLASKPKKMLTDQKSGALMFSLD